MGAGRGARLAEFEPDAGVLGAEVIGGGFFSVSVEIEGGKGNAEDAVEKGDAGGEILDCIGAGGTGF